MEVCFVGMGNKKRKAEKHVARWCNSVCPHGINGQGESKSKAEKGFDRHNDRAGRLCCKFGIYNFHCKNNS